MSAAKAKVCDAAEWAEACRQRGATHHQVLALTINGGSTTLRPAPGAEAARQRAYHAAQAAKAQATPVVASPAAPTPAPAPVAKASPPNADNELASLALRGAIEASEPDEARRILLAARAAEPMAKASPAAAPADPLARLLALTDDELVERHVEGALRADSRGAA